MVSDKIEFAPTCTLPNARLAGFAPSAPGVAPLPESAIFRFGFDPFDVTAMLPLTPPLAVGANCTEKEVLWPAFRISGTVSPLMVKPVPLADSAEIVTLLPPELVKVSVSVFVLPTRTFPKLRLTGLGVICPCETPVPDSAIFKGEPGASETIASVPFAAPAAAGVKVTLNDTL